MRSCWTIWTKQKTTSSEEKQQLRAGEIEAIADTEPVSLLKRTEWWRQRWLLMERLLCFALCCSLCFACMHDMLCIAMFCASILWAVLIRVRSLSFAHVGWVAVRSAQWHFGGADVLFMDVVQTILLRLHAFSYHFWQIHGQRWTMAWRTAAEKSRSRLGRTKLMQKHMNLELLKMISILMFLVK